MICFLIKYDKRYDHLIEHLSKMLLILYNYKDNITIIITHSEDCSLVDKENIKAIFNDSNFSITNIIFTTINDPHSLTLCYLLENLKI
jgi:hypothetical protein